MPGRFFLFWGLISLLLIPTYGQVPAAEPVFKAEIKGTPRIIHYTRKDFEGDPQIWSMCQDDDGIMYFGNNDGTLIFDGARWHKVALPNNSSVRSLLFASDGKVYAGGFNEFGTIERDPLGNYMYHSLMGQLRSEDQNLENIWAIHEVQNHIVFRSFSKLVALAENKAFTIPATSFYQSSVINGKLYLVSGEGLKSLDMETLEFDLLVSSDQMNRESVSAILKGFDEEELILFTKPGNAYTYHTRKRTWSFFKKYLPATSSNQILSAIKSSGGNIYLGTLSSQIEVLDREGEIVPGYGTFMELQDNTVLNLFESAEGNIWALLNNGIDCINISSPISVLFENASSFDALISGGKIYGATNQGVLVSERIVHNPNFASMKFQKVPGLEGQAWSLQTFHGKVLCSHDRGVFVFEEDGVRQLEGLTGVWKVIPLKGRPGQYFVCTYTGIYLMEYSDKSGFRVLHKVEGFNESSRDIMQSDEEGVFWVCHGYKGIFRIKLDKQLSQVVGLEHFREKGLPSPFSINVFRWEGQIIFTTNAGIYTFNREENRFQLHEKLTNLLGSTQNIRKISQYEEKTWFVQDDEVGYFHEGSTELHKGLFLELKGTLNRGMECILPINNNNVLIGTTTGLYAYDLTFRNAPEPIQTLITEVSHQEAGSRIKNPVKNNPVVLPHQATDIRFEFSAPKLKDQKQVQYSYQLEGMDEEWSPWGTEPFKEYTQLYPGKYTFKVKARSMIGETTLTSEYAFTKLPVWFLNRWAFAIYLLLIVSIIIGSRKMVKQKIAEEKEKTRAEEQKKQTVLELELQQMRLEREKERIEIDKKLLEEDVIFKSKELANYTMLLVRKRELLTDLREDLKELKEVAKNETSRNMLRNLIRKIGINLSDEEHIHVFEANFERVHHEFFQELKTHFPDLTSKELRLCALVKMNLTNKEIAPILNISLRGVETARYRLRKRLSLGQEDNMVEFLEKLAP